MGQSCGCVQGRTPPQDVSDKPIPILTSLEKCEQISGLPLCDATPCTTLSAPSNDPAANFSDTSESEIQSQEKSEIQSQEIFLEIPDSEVSKFPRGPSTSAEDIVGVVERMWETNIFQTQDYLYEILSDSEDPEFVGTIRNSIPYTNVLRMLGIYDHAAKMFEPMDNYRVTSPITINYKELGIENVASCASQMPLYWKKVGAHLSLRFFCEFPRQHFSGKPFAIGYAAMLDELDLWHQWNPVMANRGPTVIQHGEQDRSGEFPESAERMFEQSLVILKFLRFLEINRNYKFLPPGKAAYMEVLDVVSDNDVNNNREILKSSPHSRMRKTDPLTISNVMIMQKDTCFVGVSVEMVIARVAPAFFLSWILQSLVPIVVRNLFKSGSRTLDADNVYYPVLEEDRKGFYKAISSMQDRAAELEEARGYRYDHKRVPVPDYLLDMFSGKNLLDLDLNHLTSTYGAQVPQYGKFTRES